MTWGQFFIHQGFNRNIGWMHTSTGGESGHPGTQHVNDEALRYARGQLRAVYFYPSDLIGHVESTCHPGDRGT